MVLSIYDCVNFMNITFFGLNANLSLVFIFIVLLCYRTIYVFLIQKFSCLVVTHGYAT